MTCRETKVWPLFWTARSGSETRGLILGSSYGSAHPSPPTPPSPPHPTPPPPPHPHPTLSCPSPSMTVKQKKQVPFLRSNMELKKVKPSKTRLLEARWQKSRPKLTRVYTQACGRNPVVVQFLGSVHFHASWWDGRSFGLLLDQKGHDVAAETR